MLFSSQASSAGCHSLYGFATCTI